MPQKPGASRGPAEAKVPLQAVVLADSFAQVRDTTPHMRALGHNSTFPRVHNRNRIGRRNEQNHMISSSPHNPDLVWG